MKATPSDFCRETHNKASSLSRCIVVVMNPSFCAPHIRWLSENVLAQMLQHATVELKTGGSFLLVVVVLEIRSAQYLALI